MFDFIEYYLSMIEQLRLLNDKTDKILIVVLCISFMNLMFNILNKRWINKNGK